MAPTTPARKSGVKKQGLSRKSSTKVAADKKLQHAKSPDGKKRRVSPRISPRKSSQGSQNEFQTEEKKLNVKKFVKAETVENCNDNWDTSETEALLEGVKNKWDMITSEHKGSGSKAKTEKAKLLAWEHVTQLVNA